MMWNESRRWHHSTLQLGDNGVADFRIVVDGDQSQGLCTDQTGKEILVSGAEEDGQVWSIGRHQLDKGAPGDYYDVRLHLNSDGALCLVDWARLQTHAATPSCVPRKYWIKGSWDDDAAREMNWDPVRQCFHYNVTVGNSGQESFQIYINNVWHQCLYPEQEDGHFYNHSMCGPDSLGHDSCWTIGKHTLDGDAAGAQFEVRLRVTDAGDARDVDWVRMSARQGQQLVFPGGEDKMKATICSSEQPQPDQDEPAYDVYREVHRAPPQGDAQVSVLPEHRAHVQRALATAQAGCAAPQRRACRSGDGHAPYPEFYADSDGEELALCRQCGLPLPEFAYTSGTTESSELVHGECIAQRMVDAFEAQDEDRLRQEAGLKQAKRLEYGIGWRPQRAPHGAGLLAKLGVQGASGRDRMYSLVLDAQARTVRAVPTSEPAEAVNFAYLSLAMQVRLREDREPMFSLDPIDDAHEVRALVGAAKRDAWMQAKRFEPAWLAGTSVGEVMFQADYHLKELSMGEFEQPVLGMTSAHDLIVSGAAGDSEEWNAREWFVVRKAAVHLSEGNALIPYVKMGVEAREQVRGSDGLEDATITRPSHPLVRYAEAFTENFDLIAERKSVIFHLRELAKASVLAKFFLDAKVLMDGAWFALADEEMTPCVLTVPQLWNERCYSQVRLKDGRLEKQELAPKFRGVYGGVEMGLGQFPLGQAIVPGARPGPPPPPAGVRAAGVRALRHKGVRLPTSRLGAAPAAPVQAMRLAGLGFEGPPQGVDLNLDAFNLSEVASQEVDQKVGSWAGASTFWTWLDGRAPQPQPPPPTGLAEGGDAGPTEEDLQLLRAVFHPRLSDRREEAESFVPPDTRLAYVQHLQRLVEKEEKMKHQRKECFLSTSFSPDEPGALFPAAWTRNIRVSHGSAGAGAGSGGGHRSGLQVLPEYAAQAEVLAPALRAAEPVLDRSTQDGLRFRIYRVGCLEVRTTTDLDGKEVVGQVFGLASTDTAQATAPMDDADWILRVTQYVEEDVLDVALEGPEAASRTAPRRRYYVVLLTRGGAEVVTEKLEHGAVTWQENPIGLKDRNERAKVLRSEDAVPGITVRDMKVYKASCFSQGLTLHSKRKRYAQGVLKRATQKVDVVAQRAAVAAATKGRGKGSTASLGRASAPLGAAGARAPGLSKLTAPGPRRAL
mmetsp:Transcript_8060/g.29304  ORF Transcript_8060/g.29304 Transcript_8060/m.29304 type:complete len:1174 (-) Transcript_8060:134-3655(-)